MHPKTGFASPKFHTKNAPDKQNNACPGRIHIRGTTRFIYSWSQPLLNAQSRRTYWGIVKLPHIKRMTENHLTSCSDCSSKVLFMQIHFAKFSLSFAHWER